MYNIFIMYNILLYLYVGNMTISSIVLYFILSCKLTSLTTKQAPYYNYYYNAIISL